MRINNTDVTNEKTTDQHAPLATIPLKELNQAPTVQTDNHVSNNIDAAHSSANLLYMRNYISQLQELISSLDEDQQNIKDEWKSHTQTLKQAIKEINAQITKIQTRYDEITASNEEIIRRQQQSLNINKLIYKILNKFRISLRPKIGVLYQYDNSTPMTLPKHYYNESPPNNPPTIAIVTPSFNQGEFIERTILSVINQQYPRLEYVIQDGNSDDETVEIIRNHASAIKHWESKPDTGQSNAINLGFRHTSSEIMAYLNSDDILLPGTLAYVAKYFADHPEVDVVYGHRIVIDVYDHEVGRWILPQHDSDVITWVDYIPQETLFWRRRIWDKVGGKIDEKFKFAMDWDLILRFREAGAKFVRLPRFLGGFRAHAAQKTSAQINDIGKKEMYELRKRCHGRYVAGTEVIEHVRNYQIRHLVLHKLYRLGLLRY